MGAISFQERGDHQKQGTLNLLRDQALFCSLVAASMNEVLLLMTLYAGSDSE